MADDRAPRMSNEEYFRCLETAANARSAADVRRVRDEVMRRWAGDPRADDLTEALYAHETRFTGNALGGAMGGGSADGWSGAIGESGRWEQTRTSRRWA